MQVDEPETLALTASEVHTLAVLASERDPDEAAHPDEVAKRLDRDAIYDAFLAGMDNGYVRVGVQIGGEDDRFYAPTFSVSPGIWRFLIVRHAVSAQ